MLYIRGVQYVLQSELLLTVCCNMAILLLAKYPVLGFRAVELASQRALSERHEQLELAVKCPVNFRFLLENMMP